MELSEEEVVRLYRLLRNLELTGACISEYAGYHHSDDTMSNLRNKIKDHVDHKGPEWMRSYDLKYWW